MVEESATEASNFKSEMSSETREVREKLFSKYKDTLQTLKSQKKEKENTGKPRICVVVSLWEEDNTRLTEKMFDKTLGSLTVQAEKSGYELDILMVANNGGGKTKEDGDRLVQNLSDHISTEYGEEVTISQFRRPEGEIDAGTPWNNDLDLSVNDKSGNRYFMLPQPKDDLGLNAGKMRSLRDATKLLSDNWSRGYQPDLIFQIDAESMLMFSSDEYIVGETYTPLKVLVRDVLNNPDDRVVASGSRDIYSTMNQDGTPTWDIPPVMHEGLSATNKGEIPLSGGGIMAKSEYYLSAVSAISEVAPSGPDDYAIAKLWGVSEKINGEKLICVSEGKVNHLNRCSSNPADALVQVQRWDSVVLAIDEIIPENSYSKKPLISYVAKVIKARFESAKRRNDKQAIRAIRTLADDLLRIPSVMKVLSNKEKKDILAGGSDSWFHTNKKVDR